MNPAALTAIAVAAVLAGTLLAVVGIVGTRRPSAPAREPASRAWALIGVGLPARQRRTRQWLIGGAAAATALVWLVTGWPVAGLIAGIAVIGVPWLFSAGRAEQRTITKLEAIASWTRRLRDLVQTGHGLVSAIVTSARSAPPPIAAEVTALAAGLQSGADPQHAFDEFADQLGGFTSDEVIAALKLHASDRGQRLTEVLGAVAEDASEQAISRRGIAAKRAEPRFVTQIMTVLILIVLAIVFLDRSYATPYGSLLGEAVLFAAMLVMVGLLVWIRRLSQPAPPERLLAPAAERRARQDAGAHTAVARREASLR
jgi:Flp pilus assembly protein TadB